MIYIVFSLFTLGIIAFAFYHWQYFMVFSPTYYRDEELDDEFEILSITTDDGIELEGVVYEPKSLYRKLPTIKSTLLFFAGRSHDSVGLIKRLSLLFPHVRIITFNYRSYGRSEGVVNEKNILVDSLKVAQIVKKNYGDFYVLGFSIGSLVAAYVASKMSVLGVFLVGPFDSITLLVKEKYGLHIPWLLRYKFDKTKLVSEIDAKTYIFASKDDEIIYIKNTRNLKQYVKNLALYKEYEGLTHKELLWHEEVSKHINEVLE
ncbi:alpha/beta hydrolase [Candidatus Sulfurimonas marisnigri]|uniref:Alpha/beta hydrolase n=1 Tax=Candidatus Sulfurimonas marisnigri TaxID=2740405 RepID=A0A7S7M2X4_9BACT|nr:alpha/beta hydrolase [Candidatus Sulfurimonas marisnigri]QOY55743.1 alpha/beta hydrolase [Candidatus Sulfurimonas marisnigri]